MKKRYSLENVRCQSCAAKIEKIGKSLDGVKTIEVNLALGELEIVWNEKIIDELDIIKNIESLGYGVKEIEKLKKIEFTVTGLHCQSCVATIQQLISKIDGVKNVSVNLSTETGMVEFDEKTKFSQIKIEVEKYGYKIEKINETSIDEREEKLNKELKRELKEFFIAIFFGILIMYISMSGMMKLPIPKIISSDKNPLNYAVIQLICSIPVVYIGRKFYINGFRNLLKKNPTMDTLIAMGTTAAFLYSIINTLKIFLGDIECVHNLYYEAGVMIISLISLGKYFEKLSKGKTSEAIKKLMKLQIKKANLLKNEEIIEVDIEELELEDIVIVKPGESIPVDGIVIEGVSEINESMLTGESLPVRKTVDDLVYAATLNESGVLKIKVNAVGKDTILSKIIKLVENAQVTKAPIAKLADKISLYFVPGVIIIALMSSLVWYILGSIKAVEIENPLAFSLKILISVLVIACPCSLGLATPTAVMVGTGRGAELGILIKTGEALEKLGKIDTVVLDKTGTITEGKPRVIEIISRKYEKKELLKLVASLERYSEHPIGKAIVNEINDILYEVKNFNYIPGEGVSGDIITESGVIELNIGNRKKIEKLNLEEKDKDEIKKIEEKYTKEGKIVIFIIERNEYIGSMIIADKIKSGAKNAIEKIRKMGIEVIILSGDNKKTSKYIGEKVGVENIIAEVSPEEKFLYIKKLQNKNKKVAMVGDGINDSPALSQSDVGIAIGGGADIALESADIVLMSKDIKDVSKAIKLSKATLNNIKENLFWAFLYNILALPIAAGAMYIFTGHLLNPMIAGATMAMSSVSVVLNSLRLKFFK